MSAEQNKQVVKDYIAAVNRTNADEISQYLTDDFVFHSMLRRPEWLRFSWPKKNFVNAPADMSSHMKAPIQMKINGMIAEGDKVALEAESYGEMLNGKIYDNAYHFVFELRGGKICSVKEYSCSYMANDVFGEFNR